jgi:uncharacterized protein YidB (DUF937 family)
MGLLDSVLGAVLGGGKPQAAPSGGNDVLMGVLGALINSQGGVQGILDKFTKAGHGDAASSWVGTGDNHEVSGDQVTGVLGGDAIGAAAAKMGIDPSMASGILAKILPSVLDKMTPNGQVDHHSQNVEGGLASLLPGLLQGGLGALLGGGRS